MYSYFFISKMVDCLKSHLNTFCVGTLLKINDCEVILYLDKCDRYF